MAQRRKKKRRAFGGLGGVSGSYEKTNMAPGHYVGMIDKVIRGERQTDDEPYIAIRLVVLESFDDGQVLVIQGHEKPRLAPGSNPAHIIIRNSQYDYHLRDLKNFLITALDQTDDAVAELAGQIWNGIQSDESLPEDLEEYEDYVSDAESLDEVIEAVWDHTVDYTVSDDQPLAGFLIEWNSTSKRKKAARQLDEDQITEGDYVTNTVYKRAVAFADASDVLSDDGMVLLRQILPDLDDRIAAEADEE